MASTDASPWPVKNQAFRVTFPIWKNDSTLITGATGLDSEVSKDGGTFADCTNEATEIATSSGIYYLDLTASEMNADTVAVIVKSSSTGAVTTVLTLYTVSLTEPTAAPTWPTDIEKALAWLVALARNKVTSTSTTFTLRNDADNANISTGTLSDDGSTATRGEMT
jgi:hypothetical protein